MRPRIGDTVLILESRNQLARLTTEGVVAAILTPTPSHPSGIRVRLNTGAVGRVKAVLSDRFEAVR